jgi:hypothetical protein
MQTHSDAVDIYYMQQAHIPFSAKMSEPVLSMLTVRNELEHHDCQYCNRVVHKGNMARLHSGYPSRNGWLIYDNIHVCNCMFSILQKDTHRKTIWVMVQWYHRYQDVQNQRSVFQIR